MSITLLRCSGGEIVLPNRTLVLVDRHDSGNLIVNPPREVWERGELAPDELTLWSFLVAATGAAMIDTLPQLEGGCINYWEAGNWALNEKADPAGPKFAPQHRRVHLHLLGRSRAAQSPFLKWGEAPKFPDYADRLGWAANHQRLTSDECRAIVDRAEHLLTTKYSMPRDRIAPRTICETCGYPVAESCGECGSS